MATHSSACLENPRDGGAWWAAASGVAQSRTRLKRLSSSSSSTLSILLGFVLLLFAWQSSPSSIQQVFGSQDPRSWVFSPFNIIENLLCADTVLSMGTRQSTE